MFKLSVTLRYKIINASIIGLLLSRPNFLFNLLLFVLDKIFLVFI